MNWLDLLIVVIAAVGLIKGLFDGFIKQVVSLLSIILAIFFAGQTSKPIYKFIIGYDFVTNLVSPHIIAVICYILAFTLIIFVFKWLASLLTTIIKVTPASCLNYMLGGLMGVFVSLLSLSLIFNVLTSIDSDSKILKADAKKESVLFDKVEAIVPLLSPFIKKAHKIKENLPEPVKENLPETEDSNKTDNTPPVEV